jgi:hypothetical protein
MSFLDIPRQQQDQDFCATREIDGGNNRFNYRVNHEANRATLKGDDLKPSPPHFPFGEGVCFFDLGSHEDVDNV